MLFPNEIILVDYIQTISIVYSYVKYTIFECNRTMNTKIKTGSMFLLAAVLIAGTISMIIPTAIAEPDYYGYEEEYAKDPYEKHYNMHDDLYVNKDPYFMNDEFGKKNPFAKDHGKDPKSVNIQKIKCINANININGLEFKKLPGKMTADAETAESLNEDNGATTDNSNTNGFMNGAFDDGIDIDKNLVNVCLDF
ncbi:MAG: hypothetical protein R3321_10880, partial [Nitrososphaeraceae archaeon]|nr:hypothetical protein [Nitrososphaeraceae archaeon]